MTTVLLHPVGLDAACWDLTSVPGERFEFPGHGARPLPPGGFTLESIADEVAASFAGPLDLVGISMGSAVAQYVAIRHPERVRSMVLAAGAPPRAGQGDDVAPAQEGRAQETLRVGVAGTLEGTLARWFTPAALADAAHPGVAYVRRRWLANDPAAIAATWRALGRSRTRDRLGGVTAPVTVIGGRFDLATGPEADPVGHANALGALLPRSRVEIIDGPHMLHLERPVECAAAVRRHFAWVEKR